MTYLLLICALALAGVAGLQFAYLAFMEANNRQLKHRISELENFIRRAQLSISSTFPEESLTEIHVTRNKAPGEETSWPEYVDHEK